MGTVIATTATITLVKFSALRVMRREKIRLLKHWAVAMSGISLVRTVIACGRLKRRKVNVRSGLF